MNVLLKSALAASTSAAILVGCFSVSGSRTYLLRPASEVALPSQHNAGLAVLAVAPVRVPDYLDSTDLVLRQGDHRLEASRTAHWGERLSSGVTEVLQAELARRLPDQWVTSSRDSGVAARKLDVRIERFDVWPDGRCVLVAGWTVRDPAHHRNAVGESATVEHPPGGSPTIGDARLVAAMDEALETLAERIAASLETTPQA